jgi:hypothetical protein
MKHNHSLDDSRENVRSSLQGTNNFSLEIILLLVIILFCFTACTSLSNTNGTLTGTWSITSDQDKPKAGLVE